MGNGARPRRLSHEKPRILPRVRNAAKVFFSSNLARIKQTNESFLTLLSLESGVVGNMRMAVDGAGAPVGYQGQGSQKRNYLGTSNLFLI